MRLLKVILISLSIFTALLAQQMFFSGGRHVIPKGGTLSCIGGPVAAFCGAQGSGAISTGGRAGTVIKVTNLNDAGAGSLRNCMEDSSGNRVCIFTVGGIISLHTGIHVSSGNLYVAGQSAPGGGITIDASHLSSNFENMFTIESNNITMRYLRLRVGNVCQGLTTDLHNGGTTSVTGICATNGYHHPGPSTGITQIIVTNGSVFSDIFDHLSFSWSDNKDITIGSVSTGSVCCTTVSWSMLYQGIEPHNVAAMTATYEGVATANMLTDTDFHHNILAHENHRNPLLKGVSARWVNNIVYDWAFYAYQQLGGMSGDAINNSFVDGPGSIADGSIGIHEFQMSDNTSEGDTSVCPLAGFQCPSLYLLGNIGWNNTSPTGNQLVMTSEITGENGSETVSPIRVAWRRNTPLTTEPRPIIPDNALNLDGVMLPTVGASQRLDCMGAWVNNRDSIDAQIITDYNTLGGVYLDFNSTTNLVPIAAGTACADSDGDGVPDAYQAANHLPNNSGSTTDPLTGYTYLEDYLNGH